MKKTQRHPVQKKLLAMMAGKIKAPKAFWYSPTVRVYFPEAVKKLFKLKTLAEAKRHVKLAWAEHLKNVKGPKFRGKLHGKTWHIRRVGKKGKPVGPVEKIKVKRKTTR